MSASNVPSLACIEDIIFESYPDESQSLGGLYNRHLTLITQLDALARTGAPVAADKIAELYQYALDVGMDFAELLPENTDEALVH